MEKTTARPQVSDLSMLSLLAAHELEKLKHDPETDRFYVTALTSSLSAEIEDPPNLKNLAPSAAQRYRAAVCAATKEDPKDYTALSNSLSPLIRLLKVVSDPKKSAEPGDLGVLSAFVIALHKQLLAQKQGASSGRKATRFRV